MVSDRAHARQEAEDALAAHYGRHIERARREEDASDAPESDRPEVELTGTELAESKAWWARKNLAVTDEWFDSWQQRRAARHA